MYMLAPLLGLHSSLSPAHCHLPRRLPRRLHDNCSSEALPPTHPSPPSPPGFLAHKSVSFVSSTAMEALQSCALVFVLILYFPSQQMPGTGQVLNFDGVNWWNDCFLSATPLPLLPLHICWLYLLLNYFWSVTFPWCLFILQLRMRKPAPLNSLHFPSFLSWFWLLTASIDHSTTQNVPPSVIPMMPLLSFPLWPDPQHGTVDWPGTHPSRPGARQARFLCICSPFTGTVFSESHRELKFHSLVFSL